MRKVIRAFFVMVCLGVLSNCVYSQGCSDAGFCTMGAMRPNQMYKSQSHTRMKLQSVSVDFYRGTLPCLLTPIIYAATIDMIFGWGKKNSFQIKLPYRYAEGGLGKLGGMGDIALSFTHTLKSTSEWNLNGTFGGKIPLGDGNRTVNNEHTGGVDAPIHMYYQPSLGTYDIVGGVAWASKKWLFTTGIQIPWNATKNKFVWNDFRNHPDPEYVQKHDVGHGLRRGMDVVLRMERNWRFTNYNFSFSLLSIWRITKDTALIDENFTKRAGKEGTTGAVFSALINLGYQFDVKSGVKYIHSSALTHRHVSLDGLARKAINVISYTYTF